MPTNWKIITINESFSQLLGDVNGRVQNGSLTELSPLLNYLASIAQVGTTISLADLHFMKIIYGNCVGFMPNSNTANNLPQTFDWGSITTSYVTDLADEMAAILS